MKAAELRQSILQAAVQGKLVPQNVHDEPALELLKRVRQEKARLVKEGKIKREKPLPPITEEEIPYDLPNGWVWCRLGEISTKLTDGSHNPPPNTGRGYPVISAKNIKNGEIIFDNVDRYTDEAGFSKENPRTDIIFGDIILGIIGGSIGNLAIFNHDKKVIAQRSIAIIHTLANNNFVIAFLRSPMLQSFLGLNSSGTAQGGIYLGQLKNILFPLPPLAEQQRIVTKVDELMALCDDLEAAEKKLDELENRFAEYLPKSILQAAIQGKLVPQNIHDEPAPELLKRIRQEKARFVKEGKIKKEKALPPITEYEIPYDLPDGWVWCRLGDIILQNIGGGTPSKQNLDFWGGDIPWASVKDLIGDNLTHTIDFITSAGLENSSSNLIPAGNIIVCTRMGLGKIALNKIDVAINQDLRAIFLPENSISKRYFIDYYKSQEIIGSGMTVKGISISELHSMLFPIPPLAEQQRIVAKVDELMVLCDELKNARNLLIKPATSNVVPFQPKEENDEELLIAARGDASQGLSDKAQNDVDELWGD